MLADPVRTQALLVTLPEETPVNEVVELAGDIDDDLGIALAPVVINACWPDRHGLSVPVATAVRAAAISVSAADRRSLQTSSQFGAARLEVQREQITRLTDALSIATITLPRIPAPRLTPEHLDVLAGALAVEPSRHTERR